VSQQRRRLRPNIQNLRSALDHLAYKLCQQAGTAAGNERHIYFTIAESKTKYDTNKIRQMPGLAAPVVSAIDSIKLYKGGNDLLWQLNELNNVDKHRLIFTVGSLVRSADLGHYIAQSLPTPFASMRDQVSAFFEVKPSDGNYTFDPLKVGAEVFSDQTTTEVKEVRLRFEVVIYEKDVVEGRSLLETMQNMVTEVENATAQLQPFLV
jgi:hypothetical protein